MTVKFIAEVSSNHNQDIDRAKAFIDAAHDAGCDGVKFQLFKLDELFSPEILKNSETHRKRKAWELPESYIPILADYTRKKNLLFSCTPFYLKAVNILNPFVDFHKIASYELLWKDLFKKCSGTGKPIVFSVGMATMDEIREALDVISEGKTKQVTILHCNSAYPTPVEDANLFAINTLKSQLTDFRDRLNLSFGWSDHTVSPAVIYRAVHRYDVRFIEFHLDLDGKGEEYQAGHCWLPDEIEKVIATVKSGFLADGSGLIEPTPSELPDRAWRADPSDGLRPLKSERENFHA